MLMEAEVWGWGKFRHPPLRALGDAFLLLVWPFRWHERLMARLLLSFYLEPSLLQDPPLQEQPSRESAVLAGSTPALRGRD